MAITIRAGEGSTGVNYNTFLSTYFAGLAAGAYEFNGGTVDMYYGRPYYMNGPQVVFDYDTTEGAAANNIVVLGGDELAYDAIHYGAGYPHGSMSGLLNSIDFALSDADTAENAAGVLEGFASQLSISGIGLDVEPGQGVAGPLITLWTAIQDGDYEYIYEFLGSQAQIFHGSEGNDVYTGTAFADTVFGYDGDDLLDGGAGADILKGGLGDDTYLVDDAGDVVVEAKDAGTDIVKASVTYALSGNVEQLRLVGEDTIDGTGNRLDNFITGNDAANVLDGGKGGDHLVGNAGDDVLIGGYGRDVLVGGEGDDAFAYLSIKDSLTGDRDVIKDFSAGDVIDLSGIDVDGGTFEFLGETAFTGSAGELIYRVGETAVQVLGDADGDGVADFAIKLAGVSSLTDADFLV